MTKVAQKIKGYRCTLCGKEFAYDGKDRLTCPDCGEKGILDIVFDYASIKKRLTREKLSANPNFTMWRYHELLPVDGEDFHDFLRDGGSPLYRCKRLGALWGSDALYVKDDGINPTASLKDRASGVAVARARELGYHTIACSSTGNAASSMAGNAARLGLRAVIFVPERAPQGKLSQMLCFGAKVISVRGDYKATFDLSRAAIDRYGWYNRNAGINPLMIEGKKTVALEIAEQFNFKAPDWVACSVGDGCTIGGVYNGFRDLVELGLLDRVPKILGVQSTGCCPFVDAAEAGRDLKPAAENTLADSISVGVPRNPVKALRAVRESGGSWLAVPDEAILKAIKTLASREGLFAEPAAAAAAAGAEKALREGLIHAHESLVIINSGSGLKDSKNALRAGGQPLSADPDPEKLDDLDLGRAGEQ